ncbi:hypothetical protein OAK22_05060, partial [Nitrosopumilus sp.]|nr:hypothetical protein [Nitrosopumilus sp.]
MKFTILFAIVVFAAVLLVPVDDAFADHAEVAIGAVEESGFSQSCVETGCYTPSVATVDVGGVVTMTNTDPTGVHTFTSGTVNGFTPSPDGTFDTGVLMSGDSFAWTPTEAGTVPYYCMLHTWMIGEIIVQDVAAEEEVVDTTSPVITIPELTTDQWGNENLELSMSGTTNFPTGSWTVTATDNVGVIDSACWAPAGGMDDPGDPWDSNTQSYDFSKITNPPSGQKFAIGSTSIICAAYDAVGNIGSTNFNVVVTHDDPTGFVQYVDKPNSFGNTADSTTKIFYSANSAQGLHLLKPIADLLTESNTQGMLARWAEWTLLDGAITIKDDPTFQGNSHGSFYARMSGDGYDREIAKPLATMLTDSMMAGMLERNNPDRSWTSGSHTITISESSGNFAAMVKICSPSGGGTSCQENHVLKPFADMLNESNLNQAMYERSNMKILDAGGPAASAPQSSATESTPYITVPDDITITTSDITIFHVTSNGEYIGDLGNQRGAIAWNGGDVNFSNVQNPTSYLSGPDTVKQPSQSGDGCYGNFSPQGWLNGPVTFPIGTTTVTCGAVYDGVERTATFTVTVIDSTVPQLTINSLELYESGSQTRFHVIGDAPETTNLTFGIYGPNGSGATEIGSTSTGAPSYDHDGLVSNTIDILSGGWNTFQVCAPSYEMCVEESFTIDTIGYVTTSATDTTSSTVTVTVPSNQVIVTTNSSHAFTYAFSPVSSLGPVSASNGIVCDYVPQSNTGLSPDTSSMDVFGTHGNWNYADGESFYAKHGDYFGQEWESNYKDTTHSRTFPEGTTKVTCGSVVTDPSRSSSWAAFSIWQNSLDNGGLGNYYDIPVSSLNGTSSFDVT